MTNFYFTFDVAVGTEKGKRRRNNEDGHLVMVPESEDIRVSQGSLLLVADVYGTEFLGVNQRVVHEVLTTYYEDDQQEREILDRLIYAFQRANALVYQINRKENYQVGSLCTAVVLYGDVAYVAHIGACRLYLMRHGVLKQLSEDHTLVGAKMRAGELTAQEGQNHPQRFVIYRCLGSSVDVDVDTFVHPMQRGDRLLLCTDGLTNSLLDHEMEGLIKQYESQECIEHLIKLAQERGGHDNMTAMLVKFV